MPPEPPPEFVPYPRNSSKATLEQFDALLHAFKTCNTTFGLVVLTNVVFFGLGLFIRDSTLSIATLICNVAIGAAIVMRGARVYAKATGKNVAAAIVIGGVSVMVPCMFIIALVVTQQDLIGRLRGFGLKYGFFGFRKHEVALVRSQLASQSQS